MTYLLEQNCNFKNPIVAMGTFDGVHLGHQVLLKRLVEKAKELNGDAVVLTYYHHPLETIRKKTFPYLLTERDKKESLLKSFGIDCVLYLNFTTEMSNLSARRFIEEILVKEIQTRNLVVGYDTHFGKDRSGDHQFLEDISVDYNLDVELISPLKIRNRIVSSSIIRDLIREGNMLEVKRFLGWSYSLSGLVTRGHRIGRDLGFPTINLEPDDKNKLIPALGVYLCEVLVENKHYYGLTNVGYSPTIKTTGILEVETHIIDFDGDLYGRQVEIIFNKKLRDELFFKSKQELIAAIKNDMKIAREFYNL